MIRMRSIPNSLRLAVVALALSGIYLAWTVANAVRTPSVQAAQSRLPSQVVALQEVPSSRPSEIQAAVNKDPFSETRTRPAARYRLAGEVDVVASGPPPRQQLRWAGVVIYPPDSSLNRLSVSIGGGNNAPVQRMKVGDKIGDYTLKSFDMKSATFLTSSGDLIAITNPRKGMN